MRDGVTERVDELYGPSPAVDLDHHVGDEKLFDQEGGEAGHLAGQSEEAFLGDVN